MTDFALGWMFVPDATYQLQIDDDPAFSSPLMDALLTQPYYQPQSPLPVGTTIGGCGRSSTEGQAAWSVEVLAGLKAGDRVVLHSEKELGSASRIKVVDDIVRRRP